MTDESGWYPDQPVTQSGDHDLAIADAVTGQLPAGSGSRGELVQPAGDADCDQRAPHPRVVGELGDWQRALVGVQGRRDPNHPQVSGHHLAW